MNITIKYDYKNGVYGAEAEFLGKRVSGGSFESFDRAKAQLLREVSDIKNGVPARAAEEVDV